MNHASKTVLATLALLAAGTSLAQTTAPESTLSFNVGAVSEYRYRGISQTRFESTLQAGADYAHKSGLYVGAWASGIKWIKDAGAAKGDLELDIYGGYKGALSGDLSYDVGYLRYEYVDNSYSTVGVNANTDEVYGALSYGPLTFKYSYALSNLFGTPNSKGSSYADLTATFDLGGGFSLAPHVGRQEVANNSAASYSDYALTLSKDFGNGLSVSLSAVGTNADRTVYTYPGTNYLGKDGTVLGLKYSF